MEARDPDAEAVAAYSRKLLGGPTTAPYDPTDGLGLREAEVVALFFNPQLRVARLKANAARAGAAEAGRWQDPEFGIDAERIIESVDEPWVLAGTPSITLPLSGRLRIEKEQAKAEVTVAELRALAEERALVADLRFEWLQWSAKLERAKLTRHLLEQLRGAVERSDKLLRAGEAEPLDARLLRVELVKRTADLRQFESEAREGEMQLKARLGLVPSAAVTLVPALSMPASPITGQIDLNEAIVAHPRVRVVQAEYEVAERTLELEVRRQYPDLAIGGGFGTDEGDERVLFGASLPLPLLNGNRRAIAEARVARDVSRASAEAVYEQLLVEASAARARLEDAGARVRYVEQELVPLADRQVEDARRLSQAGELNALLLLEAVRAAHDAKVEVLEAKLALALAEARLGVLVEGDLDAPIPEGHTSTTMPTDHRTGVTQP
jgi:cobalt-zinc-cadmium efflux system outer membrane protein